MWKKVSTLYSSVFTSVIERVSFFRCLYAFVWTSDNTRVCILTWNGSFFSVCYWFLSSEARAEKRREEGRYNCEKDTLTFTMGLNIQRDIQYTRIHSTHRLVKLATFTTHTYIQSHVLYYGTFYSGYTHWSAL